MATKNTPPGMWEVLSTAGTPDGEIVYAAFLKGQAERGDHSFFGAARPAAG